MRHGVPSGCPGCGSNESVTRVAGMVEAGTTSLATAMAPDQPPRSPGQVRNPGAAYAAIAWLIPAIVLAAASRAGFLAFLLIYCAGIGAYGIYHFFGRNSYELKIRIRQEAYERHRGQYADIHHLWGLLEYCGRCHGVFLPGNEWQKAVNPELGLVPVNQAWRYALDLARYRWGSAVEIVVNDTGPVHSRG